MRGTGLKQQLCVCFVLISLCIGLRFPSFDLSVIDHDESTYLVIAEAVLRGQSLYIDIWDTKPVGIFLFVAMALKVMGGSIWGLRFFGALVIGLSASLLFMALARRQSNLPACFFGALIFLGLSSAPLYGLPCHIEHFFAFFTAAGFFALSTPELKNKESIAGILFGLGFIVKYVVLLEALPLFFFLVLLPRLNEKDLSLSSSTWEWFKQAFAKPTLRFVIALLLPFILCHLYFLGNGHFEAFYRVTYVIPSRYISEQNWYLAWQMIADYHQRWWPLIIPSYLGLFLMVARRAWSRFCLGALWLCVVWLSVLASGKYFTHYLLQLSLPLAYCAHEMLRRLPSRRSVLFGLLVLTLPMYALFEAYDHHKTRFQSLPDIPREVAAVLQPLLREDDLIYTANFDHVLYHLLKRPSPTPYVHRSLMTNPRHLQTLQINPIGELDKILKQKPRFIVTVGRYPHQFLTRSLERDYQRIKVIRERHWIYERRSP